MKEYLSKIGCCFHCVNILLDKETKDNYMIEFAEYKENKSTDKAVSKKHKPNTCILCFDLLQMECIRKFSNKICEETLNQSYDCDSFCLSISLPICITLRLYSICAHLMQQFPETLTLNLKEPLKLLTHIKDSWKSNISPIITKNIAKSYEPLNNQSLFINILTHYEQDIKECIQIEPLNESKFRDRRRMHKKYSDGAFTRQSMEETLIGVSMQQFVKQFPQPPSEPQHAIFIAKVTCTHTPVYLAGRYNKLSRELPQTPWLVDGIRIMEGSVEECIGKPLMVLLKSQKVKFSSSGREDVDVRCLGRGRPFVLECLDPHNTKVDPSALNNAQLNINKEDQRIVVSDLQVVHKSELVHLKEGEEKKTKSYCALCVSSVAMDSASMAALRRDTFTLKQKTPLRVLHRRPLAERTRTIHSMQAVIINSHFFKLHLITQAGTYIKEFVHGDFGRTTPNLSELLGASVDIIALDVQDVQLDWPPQVQQQG